VLSACYLFWKGSGQRKYGNRFKFSSEIVQPRTYRAVAFSIATILILAALFWHTTDWR
jgi:hypothetical protein